MRKSNRMSKKILALFMSVTMLASTISVVGDNNTKVAMAKDYGIMNPRYGAGRGSIIWDKIKFGNYYQSVKDEKEPVKWRILSIDDNNNALLLADKGLDCKAYNNEEKEVTWENCTLRKWLNEDFYNEAFNESEKSELKLVTLKNNGDEEDGTNGGNDTTDKVYLLSSEDVNNVEYGLDYQEYLGCRFTEYAVMNGAYVFDEEYEYGTMPHVGDGYWWLRSPGVRNDWAAAVNYYGSVSSGYVDETTYAVRPVVQVNLSSSSVKDAGEVVIDIKETDEGETVSVKETNIGDGYNNPNVSDNKVVWDCVYFGNYNQNYKSKKEPIEWRVLSVDGDYATLIADKGLDSKPYNETNEDVTWEKSTLRAWLNGEFCNEAFNEAEQAAIVQTDLLNENNPVFGTPGGNITRDKLFLLTFSGACNRAAGLDDTLYTNNGGFTLDARCCQPTDYARKKGAHISNEADNAGNCGWWLRSPGGSSLHAGYIDDRGAIRGITDPGTGITDPGSEITVKSIAVRPCVIINLASSVWESAGTVSVNRSVEYVNQATQAPQVTQAPQLNNTRTPAVSNSNTYVPTTSGKLKSIKLSSVKCKKKTLKITGKVSVSGATVKIKVGKKAYKEAYCIGKKFTLITNRLKKNTKVVIKVTKKGYKSLKKTYYVK